MLDIDGDDGGGQIVRTAVSLSVLEGRPIRVSNVRGSRENPGLRAQHRTAIEAAATVCEAETTGVEEGSEAFTFDPGPVRGGRFGIDVGTAGSMTLVFETLLPLAFALGEPLAVTVRGGTDVKWSPPLCYYRDVKLELLREYGLHAAVSTDRPGFYPNGGGVATLHLAPSRPTPIRLTERGEIRGVRVHSLAAESLRENDVAERMLTGVIEGLPDDIPVRGRTVDYAEADCPGASVTAILDCERGRAGFSALGERGTPAEDVGHAAAAGVRAFRHEAAPVDANLADQLVVPLALAGGRVRVPQVTDHLETNVETVQAFDRDVRLDRSGGNVTLVGDSG